VAALTKQVAVLRTRYRLTVEADLGEEPNLSLETKHMLYRIAQEALHNIVKHARATMVTLQLAGEENEFILKVADNGKSFNPADPFPGHLGLRSMRERATRMGGILSIESVPGQGTCVCVRVPIV
jgi:signal transduction histidine kinase